MYIFLAVCALLGRVTTSFSSIMRPQCAGRDPWGHARWRGVEVSRKGRKLILHLSWRSAPQRPKFVFFFLNPAPRGKRHLATVSRIREQRFPLLHDCCAQDPSGCWRVGAAWVFPAGPEGDLASLQWGVSRQLRESGWWWLGTGLGDW